MIASLRVDPRHIYIYALDFLFNEAKNQQISSDEKRNISKPLILRFSGKIDGFFAQSIWGESKPETARLEQLHVLVP